MGQLRRQISLPSNSADNTGTSVPRHIRLSQICDLVGNEATKKGYSMARCIQECKLALGSLTSDETVGDLTCELLKHHKK